MLTANLEKLAGRLNSDLRRSSKEENFITLFKQLLFLLSDGKPVSPEQIAGAIGKSREEVITILHKLKNVELDENNNLIGMGLTFRPTSHQFELDGRNLFTWCALDALMFPIVLGKSARVKSPCKSTGIPIEVEVTPDKVEGVKPESAVVSVIMPEVVEDIRSAFCIHINFFSSQESASEWLNKHPNAVVLSVADAYQLGRMLVNRLFKENLQTNREI
jgi:alkylmercury lyase